MSATRQGGFRRLRQSSASSNVHPPLEVDLKYREERPLSELHPDLSIYEELPLLTSSSNDFKVCKFPAGDLDIAIKPTKVPIFRLAPTGAATFDASNPYLLDIGFAINRDESRGDAFYRFLSNDNDLLEPYSNGSSGPFPGFNSYVRVEYDMDKADFEHLRAVNKRRTSNKSHKLSSVSREAFEATMTLLEIAWFDLESRMPPRIKSKLTDEIPDSDDQKCVVCDDGECDNNNAIVFCDGCDIGVHQDCYGVPFIPEGQWLCRSCQASRRKLLSCAFCPNKSGAFKRTDTGEWAHLVCSIWIPETRILDPIFLEPVSGLDRIDKNRWKLVCYICKKRTGACIQCSSKKCPQAYHATCGRKARLYMKMAAGIQGALLDQASVVSYCDRHTPAVHQPRVNVRTTVRAAKEYYRQTPVISNEVKIDPSSVHPWKTKKGIPVIPEYIAQRVAKSLSGFRIQDTLEWVYETCQYWALKRETKNGAYLLKRLQMASPKEELDFSSAQSRLAELEHMKKVLVNLRIHAEKVRAVEALKHTIAAETESLVSSTHFNYMQSIIFIWSSFCKADLALASKVKGKKKILSHSPDAASISKKIKAYKYKSIDVFRTDIHHLITLGSRDYPYFVSKADQFQQIVDKMLQRAEEEEKTATSVVWDDLMRSAIAAAPMLEIPDEDANTFEVHVTGRKRKRIVDDI